MEEVNINKISKNGIDAVVIHSKAILIKDVPSALDLVMSMNYEYDCNRIIINKEAIVEDFFILSTCLAGEILQKFITYGIKIDIVGDYSKYTSKPLKDFIYECNHGKDIFFLCTEDEAIDKLLG